MCCIPPPPSDSRDGEPKVCAAAQPAPPLEALLDRHLPRLRAFVRMHASAFLRAHESCSDLVQSACCELIEKGERFEFRGEGPFRTWLYGTVLNKIRERERYFRAQKRSPRREVGCHDGCEHRLLEAYRRVVSPSEHAMTLEKVELFERCFDQLPAEYREVISWKHIVGLTQQEIAERTGRSVASVRNQLGRAVCRLTTLLDRAGAAAG